MEFRKKNHTIKNFPSKKEKTNKQLWSVFNFASTCRLFYNLHLVNIQLKE